MARDEVGHRLVHRAGARHRHRRLAQNAPHGVRDSPSSLLISRSGWPWACSVRTLLRISMGVIAQPPQFAGHFGQRRVHAAKCSRQRRGHRRVQSLQPAAHPIQQRAQVAQVAHHLALGSAAQVLRIAIELTLTQAGQEQPRLLDPALALRALRVPVMLEPRAQLARAQPLNVQAGEQLLGVIAVGARQRRKHPRCRPARDPRTAHRCQIPTTTRFGTRLPTCYL